MNIPGQLFFDGLVGGLVYVTLALGMVLITSINRILFLAYGVFYTLGAYIVWYCVRELGLPYFPSVIIAAVTTGLVGAISQVLIFQRLQASKGAFLGTLIASLGLMLVLNQAVLLVFGTVPRGLEGAFPEAWTVSGITVSPDKLIVITIGVVITAIMFLLVRRTRLGRSMRAASFMPEIASLHGINANWVYLATLGLACGVAGLAGALLAPTYGISSSMGNTVIWTVLLMMMVGGMDSMFGAVVGGLVVGQLLSYGQYYMGAIIQVVVFVIIGIILYLKPNGLLGRGVDIGI
jgi:branched-chain amino acid transport system permease protein